MRRITISKNLPSHPSLRAVARGTQRPRVFSDVPVPFGDSFSLPQTRGLTPEMFHSNLMTLGSRLEALMPIPMEHFSNGDIIAARAVILEKRSEIYQSVIAAFLAGLGADPAHFESAPENEKDIRPDSTRHED